MSPATAARLARALGQWFAHIAIAQALGQLTPDSYSPDIRARDARLLSDLKKRA